MYSVYPYTKGLNGRLVTVVKGFSYTKSCKQKLSTMSCTESELWTGHFLAAGPSITNNNNLPGKQ